MIAALADDGGILPAYAFVPDQIQPASLDLRLGEVAYRVRASFLPGPRTTVAERIDELKLHEIELADGAVLETGCVYIVPLIESLALPRRHRRRRQSEKLDRAARRLHPRDRRRDARLRPHRAPAITARSMPRSARARFRCWCARARGCRRSASAAAMRLLDAEALARAACSASGWSMPTTPIVSDGIAVGVDLAGLGPGRPRRLPRQAPHRPDRRRPARRLRRRRFLGADRRRAPTRA